MDITVILCTYNRCRSLAETLDSASALSLPASVEWEVLVVDNNSHDQTRDVVESFCRRYPGRFRYLFEPQQGKTHALNSGIREARGSILAFTDDDVTFEPTWLHNLTGALHNGEWVGAGGRTLPERTFSPPSWLSLKGLYPLAPLGVFDLGLDARELTETPIGNNMSYRKEMFEKYGGFRTDLGPLPGSNNPQKNEDVEFGRRLIAGGERLRYEPSAVVYHAIPESRLQKRYFLTWWFDKARADIFEMGLPPELKCYFAGIPVVMFRRLAVWTLRWMLAVEPSRRFSHKLNVCIVLGYIFESYCNARDTKWQKREVQCSN